VKGDEDAVTVFGAMPSPESQTDTRSMSAS